MPTTLFDHQRIQEMAAAGGRLVDVLPDQEYRQVHLPGAVHIPLTRMARDTVAGLERNRPVIVYCQDFQ